MKKKETSFVGVATLAVLTTIKAMEARNLREKQKLARRSTFVSET
jgi:hypothetical protein